MRVSISGSPASARRTRFRSVTRSIDSRRAPAVYAVGIRHEQHRIALRSELDALIHRRKKSAAPARLAAVRRVLAREQHDKAGQIAAFAAEPVGQPRANARPAEHLAAGVHEDLPGRVIELRRVERSDDRDLVGDRRKMRQQFRELGARLAVLLERERRSEQPRRSLDEREPLAFRDELRRNLLAVVLLQRRLVVEQIELRRRAGHEQINDVLRLRREVRRALERTGRLPCCANNRSSSSADSATPPMPKPDCLKKWRRVMARRNVLGSIYSFVSASSRFRSAFATSVHAACSAGSTPSTAYPLIDARGRAGSFRNRSSCRGVRGDDPLDFVRLRRARGDETERVRRAARRTVDVEDASRRLAQHARRQRPRRLEIRFVVQRRQRLERRVRAHAPDGRVLPARRVERHEARIRRRPPDEHIEPAPVSILPFARNPFLAAVGNVPDAVGLRREDARARRSSG